MRTTIDRPDHLHAISGGMARHSGRALSDMVADRLERALQHQPAPARLGRNKTTGLSVVRPSRPITADDVHALDDPA